MARKPDGVELIITAKDESEKAFDEVAKALKDLEAAAKKNGGLKDLFVGLEERLAQLARRQQQVNQALGDSKGVQRGIDAANEFTEALKKQEAATVKAQQRLSQLEEEFLGVEAAANAAREPSEKLEQSLAKQRTRQEELAASIAKTTAEVNEANAALQQNVGVDQKAAAAIEKQQQAVIAAGQAWRTTTQQIKAATETIRTQTGERDVLVPLRDQATAQLKALQAEFQRVQAMARGFQRSANRDDSGGAVQALARRAQQELARLNAEIKQQKELQAGLTSQINGANRAINSQTAAVDKLSTRAKAQRDQYTALKNTLTEFANAATAEGAARQAANIDKLQKSLAGLQAAYAETTRKVKDTEQALQASMAPDPNAIKQREAYQRRVAEALQSAQREQAELARLRTQFAAAGVSVEALTNRQRELDKVTEQLTAEQAKLQAQTKSLESANKGAANSARTFGDALRLMGRDTRQSLGYLQRLRGEFLSIVAASTGLYAVGGAIKSIYDASVLVNKAEARLGAAFEGDTAAVAREVAFVRAEAERLKISFEVALDQYTKFMAAIPKGKMPLEQIRFTFSGVAEAARVMGLSNDDLQGVFNALTQIVSKGTLSLEELRQQLGDRLPGALERTAEGLGLTTEKLIDMVSQGQVGSKAIVLLANELRRDFGGQVEKSLEGASASVADFQNVIFDLRRELAESGFIDVLVEGLREATKAIKSPEFREGAKEFAGLLADIIKLGVELIKNFDKVEIALKAVVVLMASKTIINFVASIYSAGTGLKILAGNLGGVQTGIGRVLGALGTLIQRLTLVAAVATASFAFGTYLYNQSATVQKFGAALVAGFKKVFIEIDALWDKFIASFETGFDNLRDLGADVSNFFRDPAGFVKGQAFGGSKSAPGLDDRFAEIEARAKKAKDQVDEIVTQMFIDIDKEFAKGDKERKVLDPDQVKKDADQIKSELAGLLGDDVVSQLRDETLRKGSDKAEKKLETLRQQVRDALVKIDAEIQEKSAATLQERLEAIRVEYAKLQRQIAQAGGAQAFPKAQSSIDQIVAIKQTEEAEKEINRLVQERRTLINSINELQELGSITATEAAKRINAENERILPKMNEALGVARQIASTVNSPVVTQSVDNSAKLVELEQQKAKREQLLALEQQINDVMALRAERVQTVNALVEAGTITELEGRQRIYEQNRIAAAQLDEIIKKATEMAAALGDPLLVERLKQINVELSQTNDRLIDGQALSADFSSGFTNAIDDFISRTKDADHAFGDFALNFLREIAKMITQALILRAIQASFGGGGSVPVGVAHTGGIAGQLGVKRHVPVTMFANAVRYHSGGVVGLRPNEVPAILERGEEVLPESDPRHQANGGGNSGGLQVKIVNAIDSVSFLSEALSGAAGQRVLVNAIAANKNSVKSVLA